MDRYIKEALKTESQNFKNLDNEKMRLLHAGMGLSTESGEILDNLKKAIFYNREIDRINLIEEMGDIFWYLAIMSNCLNISFEDIMNKNIEKLKVRYGNKFDEQKSINRDLEKERNIF